MQGVSDYTKTIPVTPLLTVAALGRDLLESGKFIAEHNREAKSIWIKIIADSFHNGNYFYSICELKPRSSQGSIFCHLVTKIEGRPSIPLESAVAIKDMGSLMRHVIKYVNV
jgi:hypothetical protein